MNAIITLHRDRSVAVLSIDGVLDMSSRAPLAWRLVDLVAADCDVVRLDLEGVSHIDQVCLRLIDDTRRSLAQRGTRLEIQAASLCFILVGSLSGYSALVRRADSPRAIRAMSSSDRVRDLLPDR